MEIFAKRLKKERELHKLSLRDLEKITNITASALSKYENAKRNVSENQLIALSKALDVTTDYLLGLSDIKNEYKKL